MALVPWALLLHELELGGQKVHCRSFLSIQTGFRVIQSKGYAVERPRLSIFTSLYSLSALHFIPSYDNPSMERACLLL